MISHCLGIWLTASAAASANWNALKEVISWPTSVKGVDYVLTDSVKTLAAGWMFMCALRWVLFLGSMKYLKDWWFGMRF